MTYHPQSEQRESRLLWICIAGSMLLHALVVWQGHGVPPAPPLVQQIKATIRPYTPPAPPPVAAAPEPRRPEPPKEVPPPEPAPPPRPVPQRAAPKVPEVAPKPTLAPVPAQSQPAAVAPSAPPVPATPAESKSDAKTDVAKAVTPAPSSPAASSPAPSDLNALIQSYQQQLAQAAQKTKRYPSEAMQQGWEGTAQVRVKVGADGRISGIELVSSSGHEMLDEQAKITASKAKPFVQIPTALRGQAFDAEIRVVFSMKAP